MRRILPALMLCGALLGQTATVIMKAPEKEPESLAQLARKLKRDQGAGWVLLEGPQGAWLAEFRDQLRTDEDLQAVGLPVRTLGAASPLAAELRARQGWGPEAAWALVGPEARVLESGRSLPSPRQLADQLDRHGIHGEIRDLEAFLALHPGHIQAAEKLLGRYLGLADRRTSALLKPAGGSGADPERPPELPRPLTEAEDARIWGKAAAMMERMILSGDWRLGPMFGWGARRYATGRFSQLMQAASRRCLPVVEEALRQHPGHFQPWLIWVQLAENVGGRPLRPLLDSLVPAPWEADAIPEQVFAAYVRDAKARGDWNGIVEVMGPRWDRRREESLQVVSIGEGGKVQDPLKPTWDALLHPLVEAQLRGGNAQEADRIIREAMAWMPSKELPGLASRLALRCGQPSLAAQWASLSVPKG